MRRILFIVLCLMFGAYICPTIKKWTYAAHMGILLTPSPKIVNVLDIWYGRKNDHLSVNGNTAYGRKGVLGQCFQFVYPALWFHWPIWFRLNIVIVRWCFMKRIPSVDAYTVCYSAREVCRIDGRRLDNELAILLGVQIFFYIRGTFEHFDVLWKCVDYECVSLE